MEDASTWELRRRRLKRVAVKWGLPALGIALVLGCGLGFGVWHHYRGKTEAFDLGILHRPELRCEVIDRHGDSLGFASVGTRRPVEFGHVPDHLIDALVATEDKRFYEHEGTDLRGIMRAAFANLRALGIRQGGSTLTQQLARQAYHLEGRTFDRKLTEAFLARRIEERFSKEEILEAYLNRIYLGEGYTGLGAAARGYFGKAVNELEPHESALLVGIIKSPNTYSPFASKEYALTVRNSTLQRMVEEEFLSAAEADELMARDLDSLEPDERDIRPHYVLEAVERELEAIVPWQRWGEALKVHTSFDGRLQGRVMQLAGSHVARVEKGLDGGDEADGGPLQVAVAVVENESGNVLVSVGGRDYHTSPFDRAFLALRPAGTAFAPLVYAAAFEGGNLGPLDAVLDAPMDNRKVMVGGTEGTLGEWGVERETHVFEGQVPAAYALLRGKNAATVRVGHQAGLDKVKSLARDLGIRSDLRDFPATFLGSSEVRIIELAHAFTVFPNLGRRSAKSRLVSKVVDAKGQLVYDGADQAPSDVLSEDAAGAVGEILQAIMRNPWAGPALERHGLEPAHFAGKPGGSYGFADSWFAGYSAGLTCVVWMGYDEPRPMGSGGFGHTAAFPLWADIMAAVGAGGEPFLPAAESETAVCLRTGLVAGDDCVRRGGPAVVYKGGVLGSLAGETVCDHPESEGAPAPLAKPSGGELAKAKGIKPQSEVLVGDDPYGAL